MKALFAVEGCPFHRRARRGTRFLLRRQQREERIHGGPLSQGGKDRAAPTPRGRHHLQQLGGRGH